ncbi:MAG: ABC transporter ATP-binding protein [Actinomycetota bacterium]
MTDVILDVDDATVADDRPIAIEVSGVSKTFRKHSEPAKTLKERLLTLRSSTVSDFHALDGIDFTVRAGETFGILGHNGSGKSTLLKCIAATIRPTTGSVRVRGRLSALLELGAGFHPDLTGRENVYLNGSILGFTRERIDRIFDEIVSFAGLEDFIDTQVKHYSSGMYARLGFAVAVNLEPDVLLIDEVLAVGDEAFQRKCIERVRGFQADGRTICLVTHSPEQVRNLCDRAMVLDHGKLIYLGDVAGAVSAYRQSLTGQGHADPDAGRIELIERSPVRFTEVVIEPPPDGQAAFRPGDSVTVVTRFDADGQVPIRGHLWIHRHDGTLMVNVSTLDLMGTDVYSDGVGGEMRYVIDNLPFTDGHYLVTAVLQAPTEAREYDRNEQEVDFEVFTGDPVLGPVTLDLRLETNVDAPAPTIR